MSSEQRDKKILWSLRSEFILGRFAEASENVQLHGKFMHSSGWVQCIHDHYDIPGGYEFTKQDLAKALRNRYKETLDNRDIANDHGIYRDHKKEVDPLTNDGAKVDQWYFAVVPPGAARPLPRGGGAWYDDVWIKPPEKMSPRNLATNVSPGGVDVGQHSNANLYNKYEEAVVMSFESEALRMDYLKKTLLWNSVARAPPLHKQGRHR